MTIFGFRRNNRFWDNLLWVGILQLPLQKTIHSDEHTLLRKLLVAKRCASELTQSALADKLGMPQSFVSKVEHGERRLDVIEFARYMAALGLDPIEIFSELIRDSKVLSHAKTPKPPKKQRRRQR